jgi:hypothetical protein
MPKAAQRQFLVKVAGISDFFSTKSGGEMTSEVGVAWDGGKLSPEKLTSPALPADVTVSRPYDPVRDGPVLARLRPAVGRWRTTITIQPADADLVPIGRPVAYASAILIGLTDPEVDAASGEPAMLELTFSPETVAS